MRDKEGLKEDKAPGEKSEGKKMRSQEKEERAAGLEQSSERTAGGRQQAQ